MPRDIDDQYDDRPLDRGDDRDRDSAVIRRAKSKVMAPAIALILTAVMTFLVGVYGFFSFANYDAQFDAQVAATLENDKKMTPQQQTDFKNMMAGIKDIGRIATAVVSGLCLLTGLLSFVGGLKMMQLTGKGLTTTGAVLSMIPFTSSACCLIGLPFGIWVLVTLANRDVKAGYAAVARGNR